MKEQKRLGNKGFSLVELIVVIAIMAILVAVLAPTLLSKIEESREGTDYSALGELKTATEEAVLGSETIYDAVKADIGTSGTDVTYTVTMDNNGKITFTGGTSTNGAAGKLTSAVGKVITELKFKSETAQGGTINLIVTKDGKVSAKIVDSSGNVLTKKNEDKFEIK